MIIGRIKCNCPVCGAEVSSKDDNCPKCACSLIGVSLGKAPSQIGIRLSVVIALVGFIILELGQTKMVTLIGFSVLVVGTVSVILNILKWWFYRRRMQYHRDKGMT